MSACVGTYVYMYLNRLPLIQWNAITSGILFILKFHISKILCFQTFGISGNQEFQKTEILEFLEICKSRILFFLFVLKSRNCNVFNSVIFLMKLCYCNGIFFLPIMVIGFHHAYIKLLTQCSSISAG